MLREDHSTAEDFEGFLRNAAGHSARNTRIVRHLLAGCLVCRDRLDAMGWPGNRLERLIHLPGCEEAPGWLAPQWNGYDYHLAFGHAEQAVLDFLTAVPQSDIVPELLLEELDRTPREHQLALVEEDERLASPRLALWLMDRSHVSRYSDPEAMLHWAGAARSIATRCSPETLGSDAKLSDLRARAWGQYGNALRVNSRLREAEEAMITAQGYFETGTGDPALRSRLCEQIASLHTFQRRFDAAIAALEKAAEIYCELGETHALARTLVQEAIASLYGGKPEKGVQLLNRAIPLIDQEGDPHLLLAACHNLVQCYIDLDRPDQALSIYSEARDLYREFGDPLILLRAGWQEGQLLRDLGHLREAEEALLHARAGFIQRGLTYEVAVVCLDLAALYVKLKSIEDLKQTVTAMVPIFRALRVDREALACLLQLQKVADQEQQALELIRYLNSRIEPLATQKMLK